jgi:tRNA (mo5U34)-methyltransferase
VTLRDEIASVPVWYHTIELAPSVSTPGWFDLNPVLGRMPWPDVEGKRCLDVGTYDGHLAFELERRGAAEVVATDIPGHEDWDFPIAIRAASGDVLEEMAGQKGWGFAIAKEALGSRAERVEINVYDLSPERIGTFDVVVCGSLTLHLRDPIRALEAIGSVCSGRFLSAETIDPSLTLRMGSRPAARLGEQNLVQWWVPNRSGHRAMVERAGFEVERQTRAYAVPLGEGHPEPGDHKATLLQRLVGGGAGVAHAALLARCVQSALT